MSDEINTEQLLIQEEVDEQPGGGGTDRRVVRQRGRSVEWRQEVSKTRERRRIRNLKRLAREPTKSRPSVFSRVLETCQLVYYNACLPHGVRTELEGLITPATDTATPGSELATGGLADWLRSCCGLWRVPSDDKLLDSSPPGEWVAVRKRRLPKKSLTSRGLGATRARSWETVTTTRSARRGERPARGKRVDDDLGDNASYFGAETDYDDSADYDSAARLVTAARRAARPRAPIANSTAVRFTGTNIRTDPYTDPLARLSAASDRTYHLFAAYLATRVSKIGVETYARRVPPFGSVESTKLLLVSGSPHNGDLDLEWRDVKSIARKIVEAVTMAIMALPITVYQQFRIDLLFSSFRIEYRRTQRTLRRLWRDQLNKERLVRESQEREEAAAWEANSLDDPDTIGPITTGAIPAGAVTMEASNPASPAILETVENVRELVEATNGPSDTSELHVGGEPPPGFTPGPTRRRWWHWGGTS